MVAWPAVGKRTALACGWGLAGGMSAIGLIRLFRSESQPQLIGLQGIGMWLLIPAYPLALAAGLTRRRALTVVAVVLAVGQVVWMSKLYETGQGVAAPSGSATLHLVTANTLLDNPEMARLAADLAGTGADVILLQEITPEHVTELRAAGLLDDYPHQVLDPLPGYQGGVILSKLPIISGRPIDVAGFPMTRADIATATGTIRLINVHTVAPVTESQARRWRAQLHALAQMQPPVPGALVLAGDFNATQDHAPMAALLAGGMRDAFNEAGHGIGATWPQWSGPIFPLMRLDHVLVSDSVVVLSAQVQANPGSDHRRLAVDLALPPAASGSATPSAPEQLSVSAQSAAAPSRVGRRRFPGPRPGRRMRPRPAAGPSGRRGACPPA